MKSRLLVLQHGKWQNAGNFLSNLAGQFSVEIYTVENSGESLPDCSDFDALILPGYPANGNLGEHIHALQMEKQFLRDWLALNKPFLGFGSGYQLLAEAFGATVTPDFMNSAGFIEGYLTHDGREHPLFNGIPPNISLLQWYNPPMLTPVPQNCLLLATSRECVVEAFTIKGCPHIIAMRCNNHIAHPDDVSRWVKNDPDYVKEQLPEENPGELFLDQAEKLLETNRKVFRKLIVNFMSFTKK